MKSFTPDKLKREFNLSLLQKWHDAIGSFSFVERAIFYVFAVVLAGSTIVMLISLNNSLLVEVPAKGGKITEGIIGTPRFINPLLAISDADRDITSLVYSGLMKATPEGDLIPDLAQSYEISEDGLSYTFTIRDEARFHDGQKVTATDVLFTIAQAQNSALKSPKRANWEGIITEKIDERTVKLTLRRPYSPFLENTTLGILPEHLWKDTTPEQFNFSKYNIEPVGSGPFVIDSVKRDSSGFPEKYTLRAFSGYTLGEPHLEEVRLRFYPNEEELVKAYRSGDVTHINSITPAVATELALKKTHTETYPLPRIFGVFLNQTHAPVFTNEEVRKALNIALDKDRVVAEVLSGYGVPIEGPLPPGITRIPSSESVQTKTGTSTEEVTNKDRAIAILENNGWEFDEELGVMKKTSSKKEEILSFSISTSNVPELKRAAEIIKDEWEQIGAKVELRFFEIGSLNQDVIRPRKYDTLLFGQIIGRDLDPFAFWHSSQRNDPGLNIALYASISADRLLENIRTTSNRRERLDQYSEFDKEVREDVPAVFIYSPDFIYIVSDEIKGFRLGTVTVPSERFLNVHEWHVKTDKVWSFLART